MCKAGLVPWPGSYAFLVLRSGRVPPCSALIPGDLFHDRKKILDDALMKANVVRRNHIGGSVDVCLEYSTSAELD